MTETRLTREQWLVARLDDLRQIFQRAAVEMPSVVAVTCGWPSRGGLSRSRRVRGQCWQRETSAGNRPEIFVSPMEAESVEVLAILCHELIHAAGVKGHRANFRKIAGRLGLDGKGAATQPSVELRVELERIVAEAGPYPHYTLTPEEKEPKAQKNRQVKFMCEGCGWLGRAARATLAKGVPSCPVVGCERRGREMEVERGKGEEK